MGQVVHQLDTDELYKMRLKMGMMFQVSGLFTDMSVYDNLAFRCVSTPTCRKRSSMIWY